MFNVGDTVYVLCWLYGYHGDVWCKATIKEERKGRYLLEMADGTGTAIFPKDEVYGQPDLRLSKQVQK